MKFQKIKEDIYFCGLNDNDRKIFDELIPLENGTSYNSYLVKGSEKTAVIDAMYLPFGQDYLKNFDENGVSKVDYIIANHGEQDHTGVLPLMLEKFPEAKIVTNKTCAENLKSMLFIPEDKIIVVQNEEELSLGNKTLKFIFAPNVHWPDTMFTYIEEDNILCTCDFLGAHYTFEDVFATPSEELKRSVKRYYAEIMMPFRVMCKKYLQIIKAMNVDIIMPSHGPIYKDIDYILDLYTEMTKDETKNLVVLPYVSMYGSVKEMIEYLDKNLRTKGVETFKFDIIRGDLGELATAMIDATTIVIGTSMVLAGPHPASVNVAYITDLLKPKAKFASFVGSFGWGGKLFEPFSTMLSKLRLEVIDPVLEKGKATPETYKQLDVMIDSIVEKHKSLGLI